MNKLIWGLVLLISVGAAQAQLVPKGMAIYGSVDGTDVVSQEESSYGSENSVPDSLLNWNEDRAVFADSVSIYMKDYNYNIGKAKQFARYGGICGWAGLGIALIGIDMLSAGLAMDKRSFDNALSYGGVAMITGGFL